ncbi:MAG: DNA recombination protein RmuC [Rehaibacterium terrae]|uniref:DNA recombination protein RmuC n=2 Tax=Rehaibacterium terrae TaxID=1341696 RepID=UPI00391DAF0A
MSPFHELLVFAVGLALGALGAGLWLSHRFREREGAMQGEFDALRQRLDEVLDEARRLDAELAGMRSRGEEIARQRDELARAHETLQQRHQALSAEHARLQASSREQALAAEEKLQLLQQAETKLRDAFQNLAQQILDEKARRFAEHNEKQLGGLLDPLKVQLKDFRDKIEQTWASEQRERGMLAQEINTLKQLNERISQDAINLTRALKGDSQAQGAWGELVLERVLEASGLQSGREYEVQASYRDEDGGRPRPDVVVHLPDDKDLVIDAKVSLVAYERFVAAADDEVRAAALREHVASLKRHIDGLAARGYTDLPGLRTLDFVLMFVPVEAAFIEAVRADEGLYGYALGKNISLVSPSTLLATLRTVAHLWKIERRNVNAMEIARKAALLHDNFALLVNELENVGTQLERAQKSHASALRRLTEGGKGSVILQVHSLAEMGAPAKKSLPRELLSRAGDGEAAPEGAQDADAG